VLGIILAGGKATRLGPLAAQLNKSLVTVGNKPMLVRQVQQLLSGGCDRVNVVVSPGAVEQVTSVIERSGLPNVLVSVQSNARGPGDAVFAGVAARLYSPHPDEEVLVMTADTLLDFDLARLNADHVVTTGAPSTRPWCYFEDMSMRWRDGVVAEDDPREVAVGVYKFASAGRLLSAAALAEPGYHGEIQLSDVLNLYGGTQPYHVKRERWQDVGDIPALARANREHFIARDFHSLKMIAPGIIFKSGVSEAEQDFMLEPPGTSTHLFPRAWEVLGGEPRQVIPGTYTMEFIDSPSLAELWLYWPSQPDMWRHVAAKLDWDAESRAPVDEAPAARSAAHAEWFRGRAHKMYRGQVARSATRPCRPDCTTRAPCTLNGRATPHRRATW
jgi:dTDP-glucose pyrophosphorylase